MRVPFALAIYLFLATGSFAEGPTQSAPAAVISNLAEASRTTGDYASAERLLREGAGNPSFDSEVKGLLRNNLADLLREEGRSTEARALFEESARGSVDAWKQRVGALIGLADIDRQQGNWEASVDRWNEVLEICRREHDGQSEAIALQALALPGSNPARRRAPSHCCAVRCG